MNQNDVNKLKVESAQKGLQIFIENLVTTEERMLFLKQRLEALSKKTKLSENEAKQKTQMESNIKSYKEGIEDNEKHIEILRTLIEKYSTNESVKL